MSKRKNRRQAQNGPAKLTEDGFINPISNAGLGMPNPLSYTSYAPQNFSSDYKTLTDLYKSHWIVKRIVDSVAGDMVKGGYTITSQISPDIIDRVNKLERLLHISQKITQGLKWARLYGGAAALILINNQDDILDRPLEIGTVMPGDFRGLFIFDRFNGISPNGETIRDLSHPDYGLPEFYRISAEGASSIRVHHSRICRFSGRELPPSEFKVNQYWGASELEHAYDEITKRDNVSWNIALLSFMANLRVLKLDGLGESLGTSVSKMQNNLYSRLQAMNTIMNSQGIQVLGKDDEFQTFQYAFGGLGEIYDRFMMDIAGACEIPVTKLFGRSPAGMNATGESDLSNYYDMIEERKETMLRPVYDKILPLLFMSECGMVPDDLDYIFNSSKSESEQEKTERGVAITNAVNSAMSSGVISQKIALKELRTFSEQTGLWTNISDEDIEEADDSAEPLPVSVGEITASPLQ